MVSSVGGVLADRVAGANRVSVCVAVAAAFSNCWHYRARGVRVVARNFVPAGASVARTTRNLDKRETDQS